jgi:hypothetical protein
LLSAFLGCCALGLAACTATDPGGNGGANRKVEVATAALTSSVTITATKVGNLRRSCAAYSNVNGNTRVGAGANCMGTPDIHRDYFIFDLSGIQNADDVNPTTATFTTTGGSNNGSYNRTITFRSYSGDPSMGVLATNWANLVTGTSYGTVTVTNNNQPNPVTFNLNASGRSAAGAAVGSSSFTIAGGYSTEASQNNYAIGLSPMLGNVRLALSLTCDTGWADCNGGTDGCERALTTDASCGTSCADVTACTTSQTCSSGACVACASATMDCDGNAANGCEKASTNASCGCAGTACSSSQTCTAGACVACAAGRLDCDGNAANGCEHVTNSVTSCGTTCANTVSCDDSNACTVDSCSSGSCAYVAGNAGTTCRASAGTCDVAESCTGTSMSCPTDAFVPSTTACRGQTNICDVTEYCTGTSAACPGDGYAPMGTDCGYSTGGLVIYSSGTPASASDLSTGFSSRSLTNAGPTTAWSDALKFTVTADTTGNGYDYVRISTAAHTFTSSQSIEYDVYLADSNDGLGGIDVATMSGYLRDAPSSGVGPAYDQNGISSHPASDLSANAYGRWYHRRMPVSGLNIVGKSATKWDVATEYDFPNATSTAYYDNIMVTEKPGACDGANTCKIKSGASCTAASQCASGVCTGSVCLTANGGDCTAGGQCSSGNCVDGVCCNTPCSGGTTDCQACSIAAGAPTNGTCATITAASNTICRPAADACDVIELCNGSSTTCPPDN